LLGAIRTNRDEHQIVAPESGVLTEWLRHDGDIVAAGLPVARISSGTD
jgi:[acyl-carrier-protein] S-malonyltransferase